MIIKNRVLLCIAHTTIFSVAILLSVFVEGIAVQAQIDSTSAAPKIEPSLFALPEMLRQARPEQQPASANLAKAYPHLYIELPAGVNGGGYGVLSLNSIAGIDLEMKHVIAVGEVEYDFVRKVNDGGNLNPKGRQRFVFSEAFYKTSSGWYFGVGGRCSKLYTTNYTKSHNMAEAGGGIDWVSHKNKYSGRLQAMYYQNFNEYVGFPNAPGCGEKCGNSGKGPMLEMVLPSPSTHGWKAGPVSLYYDARLEIQIFHNLGRSSLSAESWLSFGIKARFF